MRRTLIGLMGAAAALTLLACESTPPARTPAAAPPTYSQTQTTSAEQPLGSGGYGGPSNYGVTHSADGSPYNGNLYPESPGNNREKRKNDVRTSPNAE